jgi:geranylgeranyl pyrophosphate synthase
LGLAFQITDDLLDVEGDASKAGKRLGKDAARGKLTYPGLVGIVASRKRLEQLEAEAIEAIKPFGDSSHTLRAVLEKVLRRDH